MNQLPAVTPAKQIVVNRPQIARVPSVGARGQLTNSNATIYTAPTAPVSPLGAVATAVLTSIVFCNTDSRARTVTLYLVESGGSAAANRAMLSAASVPANTTWTWDCGPSGIPLADSETIQGLASATTVVTYRINVEQLVALP